MDAVQERRLNKLLNAMKGAEVEHLWVEPSVGFFYLTGIEGLSFERMAGLLISADGGLRLLVPLMLREEFESVGSRADVYAWDDAEGPENATAKALSGIRALHVQGSLPMWAYETLRAAGSDVELKLDPGTLTTLRATKDEKELDALRRSSRLTDEVMTWLGTIEVAGLTEAELAGRIRGRYLELGHEPADWALVASGANASMPHYAGGDVPIATTEPLLTDFGGAVDGYWSDITRVHFPVGVDERVTEIYEIVCAAAEAAFGKVSPGVRCMEVDRAARSVIEDAGYGKHFLHRTGHGVGLEVHEAPYITATNEQQLEVGHVFTIEPGIYMAGEWGLRYENTVYLGADGPESLNKSPRLHTLR